MGEAEGSRLDPPLARQPSEATLRLLFDIISIPQIYALGKSVDNFLRRIF